MAIICTPYIPSCATIEINCLKLFSIYIHSVKKPKIQQKKIGVKKCCQIINCYVKRMQNHQKNKKFPDRFPEKSARSH